MILKRLNELGHFGQNNLPLTVNTVFDYNTSLLSVNLRELIV